MGLKLTDDAEISHRKQKLHGMQKRLIHGQKGEKIKIQVHWQNIGPLVDLSISFCQSFGPLAHLSVSSINLREFHIFSKVVFLNTVELQ